MLLTKSKINRPGYECTKYFLQKRTYELLDELERVSEDLLTDIRELLESIQRRDLLEKLEVSLHEVRNQYRVDSSFFSQPFLIKRICLCCCALASFRSSCR